MSVEAISWALNDAPCKNPTAKLVLIALANHARPDGTSAFPSVARMCRYTCLSERAVRQQLSNLEQAGLIVRCDQRIVAAYIDRADRRPVGYNLCINLKNGVHDMQADDERGAPDAANGVHDVPERGAPPAPKPSLNRTQEPLESDLRPDVARQLAEEFVDSLMLNNPNMRRRPLTTKSWSRPFEGLLAAGMSDREIRAIFTAAHRDVFWHRVIASPAAFAKHFDRLVIECDLHNVDVAWAEVKQAITTHGHVNRPTFDDPAIEGAIEQIGWRDLCMAPSTDAKRIFEQALRRMPV